MGLLKKIRKARRKAKVEAKAAKTRAKHEVKQASKLKHHQNKLLAKHEQKLVKAEQKGLKAKRKHERELAKTKLEQMKAGKFNKDNVIRYTGAARTLAPFALPLVYKGVVWLREQLDKQRAQQLGVKVEHLDHYTGHGAPLRARIAGMRETLDEADLPRGFEQDAEERLDDLEAAVNNAENMTTEMRTRSHRSIAQDLDELARNIELKLRG
ncbi:DUF6474 family protein [Corynebacterium gerontici]|uniref:Uncharacterized protein n=1 Tax=Corynebacterium gerontici TaxID=2079234 RepID=A0A3G6IXH8_9CORY|nr:DUF6474 family protein [Corynebacterium gerontici]AZA10479.1 hypothetical protein CGERO_00720 [Corynebacterium gerontici]